MRKLAVVVLVCGFLLGCTPIERDAYNTIVGAKAFLDSVKFKHPECATASSTLCTDLSRATSAKDALIDITELYCASTSFDQNGGSCTPPNKTDPAYQQVADKLASAISLYKTAEADLRGVKP